MQSADLLQVYKRLAEKLRQDDLTVIRQAIDLQIANYIDANTPYSQLPKLYAHRAASRSNKA